MEKYCEICKKVTEQDVIVAEDIQEIKIEPTPNFTPTGKFYTCKECGSTFMGINTNHE